MILAQNVELQEIPSTDLGDTFDHAMSDGGLQGEGAGLRDLPQVLVDRIVRAALETMKPKEAARLATVRTLVSSIPVQGPARHALCQHVEEAS